MPRAWRRRRQRSWRRWQAWCEKAAPAAKESIKWAQPVWKVNGPVCSINTFKDATNINFWRGAELAERADPTGLLEGSGDQMRHIKLVRVEDISAEALEQLVRAWSGH